MRVNKREIENAIRELNDVIMAFSEYADSLRSVRETLEKILEGPEKNTRQGAKHERKTDHL